MGADAQHYPPPVRGEWAAVNILFNADKLLHLINALQTFTGLKTSIYDGNGKNIQVFGGHQEFCRLINADPEGHTRCETCDARAVEQCADIQGVYRYRCHAGLCEVVVPIYESGIAIAYLAFGQFLDESSVQRQWEDTEKTLDWYPGDKRALREAFFDLRQYSRRETAAYETVLEALTAYILREGIIRSAEYTDLQRLEIYLDQHYTENLSLQKVSADLGMGTTKLCALAKKLSGGETLTKLIARRRVRQASAMLLKSDAPISAVAEQVGFSDYNYFTKIFTTVTGLTPTAYRKQSR